MSFSGAKGADGRIYLADVIASGCVMRILDSGIYMKE
jgi:hypothetical protein